MTDNETAEKINTYIAAHPDATRFQIARDCNVSRPRIARLADIGLVRNWPEPLTSSQAATMAARISPWRNFKLPGTPR